MLIILRDIPKEQAQIDLTLFPIQGGFRGFQNVPSGVHYVSVLADEKQCGEWLYIQDADQVVIRVFNSDQLCFEDDDPESAADFKELALSGAMNKALITYPMQNHAQWIALTSYIGIGAEQFPPILHTNLSADDPIAVGLSSKNRFEKVFVNNHTENMQSFLAEFQFAFLLFSIHNEGEAKDKGFERWKHLVLATYNAGERTICQWPDLFVKLTSILMAQLKLLPDDMFTSDSFLCVQAKYLAEDMQDSGIKEAVTQGKAFRAYMQQRMK